MSKPTTPLIVDVTIVILATMFVCLFTAWGLGTVANWCGVSGEYWAWWKIATIASLLQKIIESLLE